MHAPHMPRCHALRPDPKCKPTNGAQTARAIFNLHNTLAGTPAISRQDLDECCSRIFQQCWQCRLQLGLQRSLGVTQRSGSSIL